MRVLVTGPESSCTSAMSRILEQAGAEEVYHRSATYAGDYPAMRPLANHECDAVVVLFRDPFCTMKSQSWAANAWGKLQAGYHEIFRALADIETPIFVVPYEAMVLHPKCLWRLLEELGLDPRAAFEVLRDENQKYYSQGEQTLSSVKPPKRASPEAKTLGYALGPGVVFPYPDEC